MVIRTAGTSSILRHLVQHSRSIRTSSIQLSKNEVRYNYISNPFDSTPDPDQSNYRLVTAKELTTRTTPPRRVKMLVRDFIDDCLYNAHYGYFSTQAVIFDPDAVSGDAALGQGVGRKASQAMQRERAEGFDFNKLRTSAAFEDEVARRYGEFEASDGGASKSKGPGRQVWHTPTELFKVSYSVIFHTRQQTRILQDAPSALLAKNWMTIDSIHDMFNTDHRFRL
jgi:hypothetical protein